MKEPIIFFVAGKPQPAGSKRSFIYKRKGMAGTDKRHYGAAVSDANPNAKDWKIDVQHEARRAFDGEPWDCPIHLVLRFFVSRPKSHYGSGRNADKLKADAPQWPTSKPDATKLCRGVEDALTGLAWVDDAQICTQQVAKRYGRQGVEVEIHELAR